MSFFDTIQHQPLLYCILIGIAFASYCELKLSRRKNAAAQNRESCS